MASSTAPLYDFQSLRRTVQSLTVELLSVYEELALLYSLSRQVGRLADENQIAAVALRKAIEISSADCGWVAIWDGDRLRVHEACRVGINVDAMERINRIALHPTFQTDNADVVCHALQQEYELAGAPEASRFLASALKLDGRSHGYLCLGRRETGGVFLSPDQKLTSAVALLTAVQLENVRLQRSEMEKHHLVKELALAHTIQQSLLPRDFSQIGFLDAAGVSEPSCEIGGDFFDLIPIHADLCTMVIADVSGKGPPAALQAAMVQGSVHAVARTCPDVPFLMSTLNQCLLARSAADRFVTAFAATLSSTGCLDYSNAGHTSALWIRKEGGVVELTDGGPLLGVFQDFNYSHASVQLAPGDLVVMYTDGITEARDGAGNLFGTARLLDWARDQHGRFPEEVKDSLLTAVKHFCGPYPPEDDRSALVVRYAGPKAK